MREPKYQYLLFGGQGEFMGITIKRSEALAHQAKAPTAYSYRRWVYNFNDHNWEVAERLGLLCRKI